MARLLPFALLALLAVWLLFARPPRNLSSVEYRNWYRERYLRSFYWRGYSRIRRTFSFGCADRWRGRCAGARQVHHLKWAYRWLFWEWLPHVSLFGIRVLCDRHHKQRH